MYFMEIHSVLCDSCFIDQNHTATTACTSPGRRCNGRGVIVWEVSLSCRVAGFVGYTLCKGGPYILNWTFCVLYIVHWEGFLAVSMWSGCQNFFLHWVTRLLQLYGPVARSNSLILYSSGTFLVSRLAWSLVSIYNACSHFISLCE